MTKRGYPIVLTAMIIIVLMASSAMAFGRPDDRPGRTDKFAEKIAQELSLTKEQKEKFMAGIKNAEAQFKDMHAQNKALMDKVEKEMQNDNPDMRAIKKHIDQINANQAKMQYDRVENLVRFKKELTPSQLEKMKAMDKKMRDKMGKGPRKGMPPPPPIDEK